VICISTAAPDGGGTGMASQKAMWWDANNNQVLGSFDTGTDKVYSAKVAANFQRFAVRFEDTARPPEVWDLASKQIYKLPAANKPTGEIYLSPLGKYLAVEHSDNLVDIFEIDSSRLKFTLHVKTKLAWSPNEKFIFANITDQHSAVFDAESGQRLHELENVVDYPAWSADASFLAIGTRTGKVRLWRIGSSTPEHLLPINDEHSEVWVSWTGTGHRLIASHGTSEGYRAVVHDFDLNTEFTISGLAKPATSTNWTRAGDRILSPVHNHGVLRVWHGQTGTELLDIELPDNSGGLWLWSPDGQQIAILCQDGIHFFDGRPIPEN
jgi:WD40 repeat protein